MNGGIVGRRYAKALINLAGDNQTIEKIGKELDEVAALYSESSALRNVILEPKLSKSRKASVIGEIIKKMEGGELVNRYCRYLTSRNRFGIINDISTAYNRLARERLGTAIAEVVVAHDLPKKAQNTLENQLSEYTGKKVSVSVNVDKSIIGGAITTIDSLVLDGSIRNRLNLIRETISKGN